jgi:chromate transporter
MILLELFYAFVRIGLFAFGGGDATLPLIQKIIIDELNWLSAGEFNQVVAIAQLTPGPIAINAATYVGYRLAGVLGATVATVAVCLPSIVLVLIVMRILTRFAANSNVDKFLKGLRPAVIALIAAAAYAIAVTGGGIADYKGIIIAAVSFIILRTHKLDLVLVLLLAGISGMAVYL